MGRSILAPGLPDPSKSYIMRLGKETAIEGKTSTAILQAVDFDGKLCKQPGIMSLECVLACEVTSTKAICNIENIGQGHYEIA